MKTLALLLLTLALPVAALAVTPPPEGGYPNQNTALGDDALFSLTTGENNTALGFNALYATSFGLGNTAVGSKAGMSNTGGVLNVAVGNEALLSNTLGAFNVAVGDQALRDHPTGNGNVAVGGGAMSFSTAGSDNVAIGRTAMVYGSGKQNVAVGLAALYSCSGTSNVGIGFMAGSALTGDQNIAIGTLAGRKAFSGSNNIEIGNRGESADSSVIRLGTVGTQNQTFIAGISGATVADGVAVVVNSKGQLGVITSSAHFKEDIKPMKNASEALLALEPVTFRYKKDLDPNAIPQFGLIAEQVAKVDPNLVARDESGQPYTVRYEAVNAMLLNEFLKEHRKVEALEATVAKLQATIEKVSARVEAQEAAPRLVESR